MFPISLMHLTGRENHVRNASSWSEATLCFGDNTFRKRLQSVQEYFREVTHSVRLPFLNMVTKVINAYFSSCGIAGIYAIL